MERQGQRAPKKKRTYHYPTIRPCPPQWDLESHGGRWVIMGLGGAGCVFTIAYLIGCVYTINIVLYSPSYVAGRLSAGAFPSSGMVRTARRPGIPSPWLNHVASSRQASA